MRSTGNRCRLIIWVGLGIAAVFLILPVAWWGWMVAHATQRATWYKATATPQNERLPGEKDRLSFCYQPKRPFRFRMIGFQRKTLLSGETFI